MANANRVYWSEGHIPNNKICTHLWDNVSVVGNEPNLRIQCFTCGAFLCLNGYVLSFEGFGKKL